MDGRIRNARSSPAAGPLLLLFLVLGPPALASAPRFTTFSVPGGSETRAFGINNRGQIVGRYVDSDGVAQGFLRDADGSFRIISAPGGVSGTWGQAINDWGDVVGVYFDADFLRHGFLLRRGVFTTIDFPGALETVARGIDDLGRITGNYMACTPEVCNATHPDALEIGFVLDHAGFHTVFLPGSDSTDVWDEALSTRVGDWSDLAGNVFGYVERRGVFTVVNVPDSSVTSIRGISLQGTLVGVFLDTDGNTHGFARIQRGFIQIDVPGAPGTTANRINELGVITGFYSDAQGEAHGFTVTGWEQDVCRSRPPARPDPGDWMQRRAW
jgi:uncharacterized membrane protein